MNNSQNKMIHTLPDQAIMICYQECLMNLKKFTGSEEKETIRFINNIERIGRMIEANEDILRQMCISKLDGEAKRWYNNSKTSLAEWSALKFALVERFSRSDSTSRTFEQLRQRKQQPNESIASYYDDIIELCQEYDSTMSQRLIISWLESGMNESLKIPVKRQMNRLPELARTTRAFFRIAKDEEELQGNLSIQTHSISSVVPYFTNTVSTTSQRPPSRNYHAMNDQRSNQKGRHFFSSHPNDFTNEVEHLESSYRSTMDNRKFNPCIICRKKNHRTIDCHKKKDSGCYKCGQCDHRVHDCPKVFY